MDAEQVRAQVQAKVKEAQERVNADAFALIWRDGQYKVSKPNIDSQNVVPLSTVLAILDSFRY